MYNKITKKDSIIIIDIGKTNIKICIFEYVTDKLLSKKIYKNIAMLTHPDKLKDKSESERKRLKKMFLKSSQSIESGGIYDLLDTAIYLDLDVGVLGADELFNLYREAELVEKEIAFHKNTYEWKWYNSNKSDSVILDYLKHVNSLQFGKHIKKE